MVVIAIRLDALNLVPCRLPRRGKAPILLRGGARRQERTDQHVGVNDIEGIAYLTAGISAARGVEAGGEEPAAVVGEQGIDVDGVRTDEVVVNHLVGDGAEQAIFAAATFDPWLMTDAGPPLVRAGGRVAGFPLRGFPADWVDVSAAAKPSAKEDDLFGS